MYSILDGHTCIEYNTNSGLLARFTVGCFDQSITLNYCLFWVWDYMFDILSESENGHDQMNEKTPKWKKTVLQTFQWSFDQLIYFNEIDQSLMTSHKYDPKLTPLHPLSCYSVLCLMYLCHKIINSPPPIFITWSMGGIWNRDPKFCWPNCSLKK